MAGETGGNWETGDGNWDGKLGKLGETGDGKLGTGNWGQGNWGNWGNWGQTERSLVFLRILISR